MQSKQLVSAAVYSELQASLGDSYSHYDYTDVTSENVSLTCEIVEKLCDSVTVPGQSRK